MKRIKQSRKSGSSTTHARLKAKLALRERLIGQLTAKVEEATEQLDAAMAKLKTLERVHKIHVVDCQHLIGALTDNNRRLEATVSQQADVIDGLRRPLTKLDIDRVKTQIQSDCAGGSPYIDRVFLMLQELVARDRNSTTP